jgi:hypothetical protein
MSLCRVIWALALLGGCAGAKQVTRRSSRELVMGCDEGRASGTIAFPSQTYEPLVRLELPVGEHRPLRLRLQAATPGTLAITLYDNTPLEAPGEVILSLTRALEKGDLSDGKDGRWAVEEVADLKPLENVIWLGVRKIDGEPTLWASGAVCGQAFVRNTDPQNSMGPLPMRRSPLIRFELLP